MSTELDRAWAQLKRMSKCHYESDFTKGYELGLCHALELIERLGGRSPEARAECERERDMPASSYGRDPVITWPRPSFHRQAEGLRAEDVLPLSTLEALNGDDTPPDEAA